MWKVLGDVMMPFGWKSLFRLTNLGKNVKGARSLVERKQTNILASIDVTVLGQYEKVQRPEAVRCLFLLASQDQAKSRWTPH